MILINRSDDKKKKKKTIRNWDVKDEARCTIVVPNLVAAARVRVEAQRCAHFPIGAQWGPSAHVDSHAPARSHPHRFGVMTLRRVCSRPTFIQCNRPFGTRLHPRERASVQVSLRGREDETGARCAQLLLCSAWCLFW